MARRWQIVRVELVGGRGERYDHPPGRVLILPPATTFAQFAEAIDTAFARWDRAHLCTFTLADGTTVCGEDLAADLASTMDGPIPRTLLSSAKVKATVAAGEQFSYVFDLGDEWTHLCTIEGTGDPEESYGSVPDRPVPVWGWGSIPDQYGRRWADDSGEDDEPAPREATPLTDPWLRGERMEPKPLVDNRAVRVAAHAHDGAALLDALTDVEIDSALQLIGTALLQVYARASAPTCRRLEPVMMSVLNRLEIRRWEGDDLLAAELLATVNGEETELRVVPVRLDDLEIALSTNDSEHPGGYLNTNTGEVVPAFMIDEVFSDEVVDVDGPEWIYLDPPESRTGWRDMEAFAETVLDPRLRDLLLRAIAGRGAFRRFTDVLHQEADEPTRARWFLQRDDALLGRARQLLAGHGIRPAP